MVTTVSRVREALAGVCDVREPQPEDVVDGVAPSVVVRPTSTEEVSSVLRAAARQGLTVVARGGGTKLTWGRPPTSADVVLDLAALNRIVEHAAGDLIVTAQAGTPLRALQEHLAGAGQRLAIDETVPGSTIGGSLATNASGPGRLIAGTMRDLLIGVTLVRADGVVAKAGGKVVKNVAGYDVGKLLVGSYGTLAVITEATFRLHPIPPARRWLSVSFGSAQEAQLLAQEVLAAQVVPAALEVSTTTAGDGRLTVLLEGRARGVSGRAETVRALLAPRGAHRAGEQPLEAEQPPPGWGSYPWDPAARGDDRATALKLTFRLSGLADVLAAARGLVLSGSAGAGVAYAAVPPGTDPAEVAAIVERLRAVCVHHRGSLVVLDAPGAVKEAVDVWGPVSALDLMRRVKDEFDPDHRLAPGRFVGGI